MEYAVQEQPAKSMKAKNWNMARASKGGSCRTLAVNQASVAQALVRQIHVPRASAQDEGHWHVNIGLADSNPNLGKWCVIHAPGKWCVFMH